MSDYVLGTWKADGPGPGKTTVEASATAARLEDGWHVHTTVRGICSMTIVSETRRWRMFPTRTSEKEVEAHVHTFFDTLLANGFTRKIFTEIRSDEATVVARRVSAASSLWRLPA